MVHHIYDNYNFHLILNKSMFFDEINLYASILDERATLYANSSLIDMLGLTSANPSMWVHMTTTEQELEMQTGTEVDELDDIDLSDILGEKHFKLIGEQNNLNHYQLVIDNELVNKIKIEASKEEDLKGFADSLTELTETYYVDFYINNSNELVKISMDLINSLNDESIRSGVISLEFTNLDSTSVQIPTEAKNSTIDLETYMLFMGIGIFFCISIYAGYTYIYTNLSIFLVLLFDYQPSFASAATTPARFSRYFSIFALKSSRSLIITGTTL